MTICNLQSSIWVVGEVPAPSSEKQFYPSERKTNGWINTQQMVEDYGDEVFELKQLTPQQSLNKTAPAFRAGAGFWHVQSAKLGQ